MSRFLVLDDLTVKAKSMCNQMLVKMDEETQRDLYVLKDLLNILYVMEVGCKETEDLMQELEQKRYATQVYENSSYEGNFSHGPNVFIHVPTHQLRLDPTGSVQNDFRRSTRVSKLPAKFNGYVIDSNLRHGFEKHVPCLKWGNQKLLHCIKVHPDDDDVAPVKKHFRSSSSKENKKMKSMMIGDDDEIEATREKLMLDFYKEDLRTRRAVCKAPRSPINGVNEVNVSKNIISPVRFNREKKREKFSVTLSRREVEDDFMKMTGRRLPRKPKKIPRSLQKQLDTLFHGLWLTEITPDLYKVPDEIETGKVNTYVGYLSELDLELAPTFLINNDLELL
ncbi:ribonuclease H-like domain-containing protein [Tanacetum coccineum]